MIVVQVILLKVALDYRSYSDSGVPFTGLVQYPKRPYNFWQWRSQRPYVSVPTNICVVCTASGIVDFRSPKRYWEFMAYFVVVTTILYLLFGSSDFFVGLLGYCALGVEATLPIPQVLANQKARSCKGFRLSVLVAWLLGDIMKTAFFFSSENVGSQFKICAGIQFALDAYLGVQFWMFGNGDTIKDLEMS